MLNSEFDIQNIMTCVKVRRLVVDSFIQLSIHESLEDVESSTPDSYIYFWSEP